MLSNTDQHHRRSIRLPEYDYAQAGSYFVTICTHQRHCLFGDVVDGEMRLNGYGAIVQECWDNLISHYPHLRLDDFVVMPNHVHGIIVLVDNVRAGLKPAPTKRHPLSEIIRAFKTFYSRKVNQLRDSPGVPLWQRNYYERVIRTEQELNNNRQYILDNPANWPEDRENPQSW